MKTFKIGELYDPAFKSMEAKEKVDNLGGIAYRIEEKNYSVILNDQQVSEREKMYTENGIKIQDLQERKKASAKGFTDSIKLLSEKNTELSNAVRFKSEQRFGKVFLIEDPDEQTMYIFDENGVCVDHRPFSANERQRVINLNRAQ